MAETTEQYRTRINQLKTDIENEPYIKEMREDIAEGISKTGNRQADIEDQFQEVIDNTTGKDVIAAPELIAARNGEVNLKTRLDKEQQEVTAQLAQTELKKADVAYVDQTVSRMSGGAIKGTYTTLSALKAAYPLGAVGPFMIEETGNRYIWDVNKLDWVNIGPYEPAEIGKESITNRELAKDSVEPENTTFIELVETGTAEINISDHFTVVGNIDINTGAVNSNASYRTTDYLSLEHVKQLFRYVNDGSNPALYTDFQVGFYSDNSQSGFISGMNRGVNYSIQQYGNLYGVYYQIPSNAEYVRFTMGINNTVGGTSSPYTYLMIKSVYQNKIKNAYKEPIIIPDIKPMVGKQIVNLGDSIFGITRGENSVSNHIALRTGATVHNCGFGGTRASVHGSSDFMSFSLFKLANEIVKPNTDPTKWQEQNEVIARLKTVGIVGMPSYFEEQLNTLKAIDFNTVDYCTIAYGTNDFTGLIPISDSIDNEKTTTYEGALRYSLRLLMTKYKQLKILVCSPIYRYWMDDENNYIDDSDTRLFNGVLLTDFVSAGKEVSDEFKVPFSDNYHELGINKYNKELYFPETDGTHLNVAGNAKYGSKLGSDLITKY